MGLCGYIRFFVGIGATLFPFYSCSFLQIILSNAVPASANILYYLGIGQHRGVIILSMMILIPGACRLKLPITEQLL
ncbi:MAG: hypothetical protein ACLSFK_00865 [Streptococcus salivarius]